MGYSGRANRGNSKERLKEKHSKLGWKYVDAFVDRYGDLRVYVRYKGKRHALPHPDDPNFVREYSAALNKLSDVEGKDKHKQQDTLDWLIKSYQSSSEFANLSPMTKVLYKRYFSEIGHRFGDRPWKTMSKKRVYQIRDLYMGTPGKAEHLVKVLSAVYAWAVERGYIYDNPCTGVKNIKREKRKYRRWTAKELKLFFEHASSLEFTIGVLALYTGQRANDLTRLRWSDYDESRGVLMLKQSKTGVSLELPVHSALQKTLANRPRYGDTILADANGKPRSRNSLSLSVKRCLVRAKVYKEGASDNPSLHGLRATFAALLAEGGATSKQIMAGTGHTTLRMVQHYTQGAEQRLLAAQIIGFLPNLCQTHPEAVENIDLT